MQFSEACRILGIEESATKEEINSRFRELSKKTHPDINKTPGAEEEYKKISAAYSFLKDYDPNKPDDQFMGGHHSQGGFHSGFGFNDAFFRDILRNQAQSNFHDSPIPDANIYKTINISFKDSILGCEQKIIVDRKVRCNFCGGRSKVKTEETCKRCGGAGRIETTQRMGNQIFRSVAPCSECFQSGKEHKPCDTCKSTGQIDKTSEFTVRIPGGARDGSMLTLNNAGHFVPAGNVFVQGSVLITVNVEKDSDMWLEDNNDNVYSKIDISLHEALIGIKKEVKTVDGPYIIDISSRVKHKDEIIIPKKGIRREADHRVIINVSYPDNLDKLIEVLSPEK